MNTLLIERALRIAAVAHQNQKRKEDNIPYIIHPVAVAMKLIHYDFPEEVIAAALVHDVLEDTEISEEVLEEALGKEVLELVRLLTHDGTLTWDEKKRNYIEMVRAAPETAKAISVADKIHNAESLILAHQKQGKKIWNYFSVGKEKKIWFEEEMLKMLKTTWRHPLVDEYEKLVETMKKLV